MSHLKFWDALWGSAERALDYRAVVADVRECSIGLFQVMSEGGQPVLLAARLTVVDRQITELETIVLRSVPGGVSTPENLTRQPAFFEAILRR